MSGLADMMTRKSVYSEIAKLKSWVTQQLATRRGENTTIGRGGIDVVDGGSVAVHGGNLIAEYPSGEIGTWFGPLLTPSSDHGSAHGLLVQRDYDGTDTTRFVFGAVAYEDGWTDIALGKPSRKADIIEINSDALYMNTAATTGSSANVVMNATTGFISRSTSSLRYKTNVEPLDVDPAAVFAVETVTFHDKAEFEEQGDDARRYVGVIAEQLDECGMGRWVNRTPEGEPDSVNYDRLTVALIGVVKQQQQQLAALTARIESLETANG